MSGAANLDQPGAERTSRGIPPRVAGGVAALLALATLAGLGSEIEHEARRQRAPITAPPPPPPSAARPDQHLQTPAVVPVGTPIRDMPVGTVREVNVRFRQLATDDGVAYRVSAPATETRIPTASGNFLVPRSGSELITARISFLNRGRPNFAPLCGGARPLLVDSRGLAYWPVGETTSVSQNRSMCAPLSIGGEATGVLVFQVPAGTIVDRIVIWTSHGQDPGGTSSVAFSRRGAPGARRTLPR